MSIEFTVQYKGQEPLELNIDMIQEDVVKYHMGLPYEEEK